MSRQIRKGARSGRWQVFVFFASTFLVAIHGRADDTSKSKQGSPPVAHSGSGSSSRLNAFYIFLAVLAVILLGVLLYKQWQKKKREEQHARLLRLFEEDDELELELGLRD